MRGIIVSLIADGPRSFRVALRAGENEATARPGEIIGRLLGAEWGRPGVARIVREDVIFGEAAVAGATGGVVRAPGTGRGRDARS